MTNRKEGKWRSSTKFNPLMLPEKSKNNIFKTGNIQIQGDCPIILATFSSIRKRFTRRTIVVVRHRIFETSCKLCYKPEHLKDQVISKFLRGFQQEGD